MRQPRHQVRTEAGGKIADRKRSGGKASLDDAALERILQCHRSLLMARLWAPAAHEMINPVSAVVNLASLMQHFLQDEVIPVQRLADLRTYLSQVISESTRVGRIASEMLAFARASGRKPAPADLNEIVRQSLALAAPMLKMEDVECHLALAESLPRIRCDGPRVQQALLCLMINAVEAVAGRRLRRITVETRCREDSQALLLEISDTGTGISPAHLPGVFEPFFTTKAGPENLGLGLTVVRRIAAEHHGAIELVSRLGKGTTARLSLATRDLRA